MPDSSDNKESGPSTRVVSPPPKPAWEPTHAPFAASIHLRIGLAVYGILVPIVCHFLTRNFSPAPAEWQSGALSAKLSFILSGECGWPIFPFLIFAMICLGLAIKNEASAFAKPWVRFGIFSGVIVCGWYLLAFSWTAMATPWSALGLLLAAAAWLLVTHGTIWVIRTMTNHFDLAVVLVTTVGIIVLIGLVLALTGNVDALGYFLLPLVILVVISTPLAFLTYLWMSIRILKLHAPERRFTIAQLMLWVTWLATFASALRATIDRSFHKYAQLPLEPPEHCYVATAAAKGYPSIVGSQSLSTPTTQPMIVNCQLATFKAAELTLRTVSPTAHHMFRFFYDRLGPLAAAMLRGPLLATAAYLCLKPAEWLCRIVLRILLGRKTSTLAQQLYRLRAKHVKP